MPSRQMMMPAPKASRIATTASANPPARVERAGTMSSAPERTTMTATSVAASENSAIRLAQMASRDVGCGAIRRRTMSVGFQSRPAAASSGSVTSRSNSGFAWGRQQIGNQPNLRISSRLVEWFHINGILVDA
jgi:hypothetical protein